LDSEASISKQPLGINNNFGSHLQQIKASPSGKDSESPDRQWPRDSSDPFKQYQDNGFNPSQPTPGKSSEYSQNYEPLSQQASQQNLDGVEQQNESL